MEFKQRRALKRTRIEIIPMIDTMFFLLVFFMLSSLAMIKFNALPVNLPRASTAPHQKAADLTVTIDKNRHFFVNKDPVSPDQLGAKLLERAGGPKVDMNTAVLVINADLAAPHGLVVRCMDEARRIGITHFSIATAPDVERH